MSPAASRYHFDVTILVRSPKRSDDDGLRSQVAELEAMLGKRRSEVARVKSDLDVFEISYRQRVGILHEQLDQLELEIAEAELGELSKGVESGCGVPVRESHASRTPDRTIRAVTESCPT